MFWLKKLIGALAAPLPVGVFLLACGGFLIWRTPRQKLGRILLACGIGIPLLASNRGISELLISQLEDQYPPRKIVRDIRYVAILGGGHADNTALPWTTQLYESSRARLVEGVRIHRQNPRAVLLCFGPQGDRSHSHAEVLAGAAWELGVSPLNIEIEAAVRDTHDEILSIKKRAGDESVALVTSAWHMPRAMGMARKAGLNATAVPTDYLSPFDDFPAIYWFQFSGEGLGQSSRACREQLGLLWTKLRGQR